VVEPAAAAAAFRTALPVVDIGVDITAEPGRPDPTSAPAALAAIHRAVADVGAGIAAAVVTNPVAKNILYRSGFAEPGHTEYLAKLAQASTGKSDQSTIDTIDSGLVTAYLLGGQPDKGLALAKEVKKRDPSNARIDDAMAGYYNQQASTAMTAGKKDQAVASLEAGALAVPTRAALMYTQAANILAAGTSPDWKKVKAEADKALAVDPNDGHANFLAGVALANSGNKAGAIPLIQKAKANAGSDAKLASDADAALKQLGQKQ